MLEKYSFFRNPVFDYTLSILLLVQLFVIPVFPNDLHSLLFNVVGTLIYLNLVLVVKKYKDQIIIIVLVLTFFEWFLYFSGNQILSTISAISNMLLFLGIVTVFINSLARSQNVDIKVILHAINGYLLLGVIAGIGIEIIMLFNTDAISFPAHSLNITHGIQRLGEYQYFGLSTLTTLGYGEITPVSSLARSFATLTTMAGQMYLAIIIAMLVGKYSSQKS